MIDAKYLGPYLMGVINGIMAIEQEAYDKKLRGHLQQASFVETAQRINTICIGIQKDPGIDKERKKLFEYETDEIKIRMAREVLGVDISKLKSYTQQFIVIVEWKEEIRANSSYHCFKDVDHDGICFIISEDNGKKMYIPTAQVKTITVIKT